jgi:hypothetical protein
LPLYVLHQSIVVAVAYGVVRWEAPIAAKYIAIVAVSLVLTVAVYELLVRRTRVTRFLFGMRDRRGPREALTFHCQWLMAAYNHQQASKSIRSRPARNNPTAIPKNLPPRPVTLAQAPMSAAAAGTATRTTTGIINSDRPDSRTSITTRRTGMIVRTRLRNVTRTAASV